MRPNTVTDETHLTGDGSLGADGVMQRLTEHSQVDGVFCDQDVRNDLLVLSAAVDAVNAGECLLIYPEGTATRDPVRRPSNGHQPS